MRSPIPSALEQMVSRQVRRWALREEQARSNITPYCVALSRLPGSGAAELGRIVADELDFGFFGIEIVDRIAREEHIQRHLVAGLDERMRDAVDRFVRAGFRAAEYGEAQYRDALMRVLAAFSERGMAVLLGRGAAFALSPERTLRVLVVASDEERLARLRAAKGMDEASARAHLLQEDDQRRRFNQHYFDVDPDDAQLYDLVVNTEHLGIPAAAALVSSAFRARFPDFRPREVDFDFESPTSRSIPIESVSSVSARI